MLNNILTAAKVEAPEIVGEACIEDYADVSSINELCAGSGHDHHGGLCR